MDPFDKLLEQLNESSSATSKHLNSETPTTVEQPESNSSTTVGQIENAENRIECPLEFRKYLKDKNNIMITQEELQAMIDSEDPDADLTFEELEAKYAPKIPVDFNVNFEPHDPNDDLPYEFEITRKTLYMYDDYLFRIPFSKNLPEKVYKGIFAFEIIRKVIDIPNIKIAQLEQPKRLESLAQDLVRDVIDGERSLAKIKETCIKHHIDAFFDKQFKDDPYKGEEEYDIYPVSESFTESLPNSVSRDEAMELFALRELVLDYRKDKLAGKISNEGMLKLKDMREVSEDENPLIIRNLQWITEMNIEKWENRCKVIRGEVMSLGAFKKTEEYEKKWRAELYPEPKEHIVEPHSDPDFIKIDGKICRKDQNQDPKSPIYPVERHYKDFTKEEIEDLEDQYIDAILDFEDAIKEAKDCLKARKQYFKELGVRTQAVERALKHLKRELKRKPEEKRDETEIFDRIKVKQRFMNRISGVFGQTA